MKGFLHKIEQGWVVEYAKHSELPLHLDDESLWMFAELNEEWKDKLDGEEVEFQIVRYCKKHNSDPSKNSVCTLDCGYDEVSYAKLIQSKEQQKRLITEIMDLDAKDGLYEISDEQLENILHTSGNYDIPYHKDSIMFYGKICEHDDGYLCEHRRKYIIDLFKKQEISDEEIEKAEIVYTEKEVITFLLDCRGENPIDVEKWFEQFKKK
jgi:hypothetical protein